MSKKLTIIGVAVVGIAGILLAQQKFPNIEDPPVVLENDHVVVQKFDGAQAGNWVGVHTHDGNQLVVILDDRTMTYKVGDEETEVSYKKGHVYWIDAVEHDHVATSQGGAVLVTIK